MNCLTEALGLSLPGNGRGSPPTPTGSACSEAGRASSSTWPAATTSRTTSRCCRASPASGLRERHDARHRDGRLDQHRAAPAAAAYEAGVDFTMTDIDRSPARCPCARWRRRWPTCTSRTSIAPAASWPSWRAGRAGLLHADLPTVHSKTLGDAPGPWDVMQPNDAGVSMSSSRRRRAACRPRWAFSQDRRWNELDIDRSQGRDPRQGARLQPGRRPLAVLPATSPTAAS